MFHILVRYYYFKNRSFVHYGDRFPEVLLTHSVWWTHAFSQMERDYFDDFSVQMDLLRLGKGSLLRMAELMLESSLQQPLHYLFIYFWPSCLCILQFVVE